MSRPGQGCPAGWGLGPLGCLLIVRVQSSCPTHTDQFPAAAVFGWRVRQRARTIRTDLVGCPSVCKRCPRRFRLDPAWASLLYADSSELPLVRYGRNQSPGSGARSGGSPSSGPDRPANRRRRESARVSLHSHGAGPQGRCVHKVARSAGSSPGDQVQLPQPGRPCPGQDSGDGPGADTIPAGRIHRPLAVPSPSGQHVGGNVDRLPSSSGSVFYAARS